MSLFERFMGRPDDEQIDALPANTSVANPPSYALLFPEALDIDEDALTFALQSYHPSLANAKADLMDARGDAVQTDGESFIGLASWGRHVIKLIGINAPVPPQLFEACVRP